MLAFDPAKRADIDDTLHSRFLAEEQSAERERQAVCPQPMSSDIESVSGEDMTHLIESITKEVLYYREHPV